MVSKVRGLATQLVQFYHDMVSNLEREMNPNHRQTNVIIMDFAKAFDKGTTQEAIVQTRLIRDQRIYSQVDRFIALWAL